MNIKQAQATFKAMQQAFSAGDELQGVRLALVAQREAKQCRARAASDLAFRAHGIAVVRGNRIAKSCIYSAGSKAEAGQIKKESQVIFGCFDK